jgi:hypothetical protein
MVLASFCGCSWSDYVEQVVAMLAPSMTPSPNAWMLFI